MKSTRMMTRLSSAALLALLGLTQLCSAADTTVGQDLIPVFANAHQGKPLRYVAIGGSITQAGEGWIGPWLREQFPKSDLTLVNSGMSATGSNFGIFRAERDIILHQPDLVVIEYCVNDGGLSDEEAIRFNETLVVRLKSLPKPPAIIFVEAASENGVNLKRHRKVAQHYGLVEIDTQKAVDDQLKKIGKPWTELFSDAVHPNKAGHAFYSQVMAATLQPFVDRAKSGASTITPTKLPAPLSTKPLLLDAYMVPLSSMRAPGWTSENAPNAWWSRFSQGMMTAKEPGTTLNLHFRGTAVSLFYELNTAYGTFYANIDGQQPKHVFTNGRNGYASSIIGMDLTPGEHELTIVLPPTSPPVATPINGPVKIGYLMVAGSSAAPTGSAPTPGPFNAEVLRSTTFKPVAASDWLWTGPFVGGDAKALDGQSAMQNVYPPEQNPAAVQWQKVPAAATPWVDVRKLTSSDKPAVVFAKAVIHSNTERTTLLGLAADYFVVAKLNGQVIATFDGPHGGAQSQVLFPVKLKQGDNELLIKVGAGSAGFGFSASVGEKSAAAKK